MTGAAGRASHQGDRLGCTASAVCTSDHPDHAVHGGLRLRLVDVTLGRGVGLDDSPVRSSSSFVVWPVMGWLAVDPGESCEELLHEENAFVTSMG